MKTINFSNSEVESMIEMYSAEMEEAQLYIAQIKELLKKLGAKAPKPELVEKEKQGKKRGPKPSVKVVAKAEPKKRGRKPKVAVPMVKAVVVPAKVKPVPAPTAKSVPVAANRVNTKKKAKAKPAPVPAAKVVVPVKKTEPKPAKIAAKAKVVVEKKPVVKPAAKAKPEVKSPATVQSVVTSLLSAIPVKEVKMQNVSEPTNEVRSNKLLRVVLE